jgi:hypothetical protein
MYQTVHFHFPQTAHTRLTFDHSINYGRFPVFSLDIPRRILYADNCPFQRNSGANPEAIP